MTQTQQIGYFAAGCFWGVEQAFRELDGVLETEVGYTGGTSTAPSYEEVCGKQSGHAEAVKVVFDADRISYQALLDQFWTIHDPTQINRQGPDIGDQYRSEIFTVDDTQTALATASKAAQDASGNHSAPIATLITPLGKWWVAEDYHQQYFEKRGGGACAISVRNRA